MNFEQRSRRWSAQGWAAAACGYRLWLNGKEGDDLPEGGPFNACSFIRRSHCKICTAGPGRCIPRPFSVPAEASQWPVPTRQGSLGDLVLNSGEVSAHEAGAVRTDKNGSWGAHAHDHTNSLQWVGPQAVYSLLFQGTSSWWKTGALLFTASPQKFPAWHSEAGKPLFCGFQSIRDLTALGEKCPIRGKQDL